jgi:predicted HTH domain antitoxin
MNEDTWLDPIVEEVRRIREAHAAKFDDDLGRIFEDLKRSEAESGRKIVSFANAEGETAQPDLREAIACKLYEKGVFSLGRAAEWSRISIEDLKEVLHRLGISREAPEDASETEAMALTTIKAAGRSAS